MNDSHETYSTGSQIKFKTVTDYGDPYILVSGTISIRNTPAQSADANNNNKKVVFKIVLHLLIV